MRVAAQAAEPFAARRKSSHERNFAALIPECAAPAEFGYEDRQKLTLVVEELAIATVTHSHLGDGDVAAFVTF
jgi:anti-sigma regulatory factor (Ser/Thr protein kinase)